MVYSTLCAPSRTSVSYFSPCHAGCTTMGTDADQWKSCSCSSLFNATITSVHKGWCEVPCQTTQILFFTLFAMLAVSVFALAPMIQSAAMRVVSFDHRDAFICFGWMFMRVFGSIPGAVLFGAVIDTTCMHWSTSCDGSMKCVLYNAENLGHYIFIFSEYFQPNNKFNIVQDFLMLSAIITKVICFLCLFVALKTYIPVEHDATELDNNGGGSLPLSQTRTVYVVDSSKSTGS
ncbi:hypothetical protein OSTOST_05176 [Ostertagia ostertagi]